MNRLLSCGVLLLTICCTESCSLQRLIKSKITAKKGVPATPIASVDTNKVITYALCPAPDTVGLVADTAGVMHALIEQVSPVWTKRLQYTTFTGKAKVHFEGPEEKQEFTAYIRIKKDSAIWVNIFGLGGTVNAVRAYITPDSLFMINYLQKEITRIPLSQVAKILPTEVDLPSLQNLIIGEPLRSGIITDVAILNNSWLLHVADSSYLQSVSYNKTDSTLAIDQVNTHDPNGPQALLKFLQYELVGDKYISLSRTINIKNGNDVFNIELDLEKVEFDNPIEMPFNVPKNYTLK